MQVGKEMNGYVLISFPFLEISFPGPRNNKPGAGLGWTEPRMESYIGMVDRRLHLPGYIGGVKKRDSKFV
jgi:hypothetical protein